MSSSLRITVVMGCLMVFVIGMLSIGCGGAKIIRVTSLVPRTPADEKVTMNGVTVHVTPINPTNVSQYPVLACKYSYIGGLLNTPQTKNEANVLPGVSFALKVTNNTGHIIKMSGSEIALTIGGTDYDKMSQEQILQVWSAAFVGTKTGSTPPEILPAVQGIPFWDESAKILPGRSKEVFVTFRMDLREGIGGATMAIFDLVTNTDDAGNPTERTNFDFNFEELTSTVTK